MAEQAHLVFLNFPKDAYITVEERRGEDRFFIIREGHVRVTRQVQVSPEGESHVLVPGDFFGVVSAMSGQSCIETAQALTDVSLIAVKRDQYSQLIHNNPVIAIKIIMQFSKRMRYLNESLTKVILKKSSEDDPDQIFKVAEYYSKQNMHDQAYYAYNQYIKHCPQGAFLNEANKNIAKISSYVKPAKIVCEPGDTARTYPKGSILFCEGEPGEELFIIQQGSVKITKIVDKGEVLLAILKPGDILGEMALLESMPRGAGAVADEDCKVLVINKSNFKLMIETQPQLIDKLTIMLAERIWLSYKQLVNNKIANPLNRIYDMLQIQLEKKHIDLKDNGPYMFDFGPKGLIEMIGFSQTEGLATIKKFLENRTVRIVDGKIEVMVISEIVRQVESFKKAQS